MARSRACRRNAPPLLSLSHVLRHPQSASIPIHNPNAVLDTGLHHRHRRCTTSDTNTVRRSWELDRVRKEVDSHRGWGHSYVFSPSIASPTACSRILRLLRKAVSFTSQSVVELSWRFHFSLSHGRRYLVALVAGWSREERHLCRPPHRFQFGDGDNGRWVPYHTRCCGTRVTNPHNLIIPFAAARPRLATRRPVLRLYLFRSPEWEDESPYPEVRAAVSNTDDMEMPVDTFRAWAIGLLWAILIPGLNQFLFFRYPTITIGPVRLVLFIFLRWKRPLHVGVPTREVSTFLTLNVLHSLSLSFSRFPSDVRGLAPSPELEYSEFP